MRHYTVHLRRHGLDPDRDLVLVKEGFSWPAFLFSMLWALWHRLWLSAFVFLALGAGLDSTLSALGAGDAARAVLTLAYMVLIGYSANDLRRRGLARRGYRPLGLVTGTSRDAAEQRLFDRLTRSAVDPAEAAP